MTPGVSKSVENCEYLLHLMNNGLTWWNLPYQRNHLSLTQPRTHRCMHTHTHTHTYKHQAYAKMLHHTASVLLWDHSAIPVWWWQTVWRRRKRRKIMVTADREVRVKEETLSSASSEWWLQQSSPNMEYIAMTTARKSTNFTSTPSLQADKRQSPWSKIRNIILFKYS